MPQIAKIDFFGWRLEAGGGTFGHGHDFFLHTSVLGLQSSPSMIWQLKTRKLDFGTRKRQRPMLMGIVNVTPDSFSDGGNYFDQEKAVLHALGLVEAGADILDIGGESTRPGSDPVSENEELRRVVPVVAKLYEIFQKREGNFVPVISVDTTKAAVARESLLAGAEIVNDVSSLTFDDGMLDVLTQYKPGVCLMHIKGIPKTMQQNPQYANDDPILEVLEFLKERTDFLVKHGIPRECVAVDPGLGFGKTAEHNMKIVREIKALEELDRPIIVGHSRKSFLSQISEDRNEATVSVSRDLARNGVHILRVHDVRKNTFCA